MKPSEIKDWIYANPKRKALASSAAFILFFLLFRLVMHTQDFLSELVEDIIIAIGGGVLLAYVIYAVEVKRKRGQAIPSITSTSFFVTVAMMVRILVIGAVLISVGILIIFRIGNWGGEPNNAEQLMTKLVGAAFLVPISILYVLGGWKFAKSWAWAGLSGPSAIGLYFWNANYAWLNPSNNPAAGYDRLYWALCTVPFIPLIVMLIPGILWLWMVRPQSERKD